VCSSDLPISLQRTIIKLDNENPAESKVKFLRWQKIIQEASEQSERNVPPKLNKPLAFAQWLDQLKNENDPLLKLICVERQNVAFLEKVLYNQKSLPSSCAIALGAEGGFTEEEIKLALSHQFIPVSLGQLILRSETAAIYTLAIVNALLRFIQKDPQG